MACTCIQSSSSSCARNFDVFVSFRGEDTRNCFTDHLFAALQRKGIVAFRDDQKIEKGELIGPELDQAIEGSRVFIVVFSKNYASSTWCLQELAKIVDWVEVTGRSVLPIFYDVTPSEVRKQSGNYGKHFVELQERFKDGLETVEKWREALKAVTNRSGWDVQHKLQHEEIEKIVEKVANILGCNQSLSFGDDLVDMDSRVERLEELLDLGSNEVRVVGICGMGGIGKTTLAIALFNKISSQYNACCFIDDVSKNFWDSGATSIQKQLLSQALNQENMQINNLSHGTMLVRTRLCHLKTLIVLDNVDKIEQFEKLALHPRFLGVGSRIIIISRDSHILRNYGVNEVYNAQLLDTDKALQLFSKKAFKSDNIGKDYEPLKYDVLQYVNGLPLAIKVLGSFLFDRDLSEWKNALVRLKENPKKDIMDVLRVSFDGLEETEKELFLDIACFFSKNHRGRGYVEKILEYRGFYPKIGLTVLIDKSLITIDKYGKIHMHDLLKELGRGIVREKSLKEPRKWSRLWNYEDLHNVTLENKEANSVKAIVIDLSPDEFQKTMRIDAVSKMNHLNLLIIKNVNSSGSLNYISNELRYLSWDRYSFMSLPSSFHPNKLVELILHYSSIKQLWKGTKYLPNLKILDLRHSEYLIEMPDLRGVPRLQLLKLEGCVEIVRIHPSIGSLRELYFLNLKNCKNLALNLDIIFGLTSLEMLNLSGCSKLLNNQLLKKPRQIEYLEKLDINKSVIPFQPTSSIYKLLMLPFNFFSSQEHEDSLSLLLPYLSCFPSLRHLDLSFCNLLQIPDAIGSLHSLEDLNLGGNKFVTLPNSIRELPNLQSLNLQHCKQLEYLPELPSTERRNGEFYVGLFIFDCPNLREIERCYRMVLSWMKQILEHYLQSSPFRGHIGIVIPRTQIPSWFNKQNVGSSISLDSAPVMEDPNWIGVASCAVFLAYDDPTNLGNRRRQPHYERNIHFGLHKKRGGGGTYWSFPILFKKDLITIESDHLLICFVTRDTFIDTLSEYTNGMHDLDDMELHASVDHPEGLHLEVKNCGYRWLFKEDVHQLNPDMMFNGNSSSRKRKFLTSY